MKKIKILLTVMFVWSCHQIWPQMSIPSIKLNDVLSNTKLYSTGFSSFGNCRSDNWCMKGLYNSEFSIKSGESNPSMDTPPPPVPLPGKSLFFDVHLGSSSLYNKDIRDSDWTSKSQLGYQIEFGYIKRLRINNIKIFSYGVGLGLSSYSQEISANAIYDTVHDIDAFEILPRDSIDKHVLYLSVSEMTNIKFIDIPVFIEIGNVNAKQIGYYVRLGIKVSFPISDKFDGMGNYDIEGYYKYIGDKYVNLTISETEIPESGILLDEQIYTGNKNYELASYNLSGLIAAGISLPIVEKKWIMRLGASYVYGFTDITTAGNLTDNMIQTDVNHILENDQSPTKTRSLGVEIGFQYIISHNY